MCTLSNACLQFSKNKPFTLSIFQKFVAEHQIFAREIDFKTNESKQEIDNWKPVKPSIGVLYDANNEFQRDILPYVTPDIDIENLDIYAEDEIAKEPQDDFVEEYPIPKYKKSIWKKGILIDYPVIDNDHTIGVLAEISYDIDAKIILIKVEQNSKSIHKDALRGILNSLDTTSDSEKFAICNCPLCQEVEKQNPGSAYRIHYEYLKNLQDKFVPKVQCYLSGKLRMLDEISILERPEVKVTIIHEPKRDNEFCEKVKELFSRRELRSKVWDRSQSLGGVEKEKEFQTNISEAEIIIVLVSPSLMVDEEALEQVALTIRRVNRQTAILLSIVVRDYSKWEDCHPFNQLISKIQILSDSPISSSKDSDKSWRKIGEKLHREIDDWLNKFHRFKIE
jgi:hypothetical protein